MPQDKGPESQETATCSACQQTLPIWFFYDYRDRGGCIWGKCRACISGRPHSQIGKTRRHSSKWNRLGPPSEKTCNQCGITKPIDEFYKSRGTCKKCELDRHRVNSPRAGKIAETKRLAELGLKHCDSCKADLDIKIFPTMHGKPHGRYCRRCASQRSAAFHKLRQSRNPPKPRTRHPKQPLTRIDLRPFTERQLLDAVNAVFRAMGLRKCKNCGATRERFAPGTYKTWQCNPCSRAEYASNPAIRERTHKYTKLWKKNNPDKHRKHQKKHRKKRLEENPELRLRLSRRRRAQRKARAEADPAYKERLRLIEQKSRHTREARNRKAYVGESFTTLEIAERDDWTCWLCGEQVTRENWSIDHVTPISRGGKHSRANVKLAHLLCNSQKGADLPLIALTKTYSQKSNSG